MCVGWSRLGWVLNLLRRTARPATAVTALWRSSFDTVHQNVQLRFDGWCRKKTAEERRTYTNKYCREREVKKVKTPRLGNTTAYSGVDSLPRRCSSQWLWRDRGLIHFH
ncbi:unnamed protein product [Ectocarpus sp. 12 AP-2014]